ncbi:enoyl-CoA hydratase-related protein [Acinetobacter bereziniae]|uniref:enoyl-CoA hydratase-related protein n=1 Tax=Acinetobacter bereziniae TaxID=106648 RepID=UPI0029548568|nr:enoyl-CoA hydratase-related protein [Acinetobacter bereziniae]MDV8154489.1 enoyl-CoA hydratase-related protein [Acinetobacter bereziniae]
MNTSNYSTLQIEYAQGVATVSINHPPVNVLDVALMSEIQQFLIQVRDDPLTRVIVFQSADPDFFIAHVDMTLIDEPNAFDEIAKDLMV